ncbi:hypothetical protein Lal_00018635 [Lupinus albus]|nr:hypothetical protein Lal_00018635 [Lupinus albus]
MDLKRPRKLNLHAPLLSTKRPGFSVAAATSYSSNSLTIVQNTDERVPFSWEQAPGKPKDIIFDSSDSAKDEGAPRLRLPPCLCDPPKEEANEADVHNSDKTFHDPDDDYIFSNAMDVFSLSEALDIVQKKSENNVHRENNDGLRLKLAESNGYHSPTYMINRFLPDATALAASSALHFPCKLDKEVCNTCSYHECYLSGSGSGTHSYTSSPKGCGLQLLFPWRMKHKLCANKCPILPFSMNLPKHQHRSKPKKHRRSLAHMP